MRRPSYRTKRPGNCVTRQLRVEQLETRELLTVVLTLPTDPVLAQEGSELVFPVNATGSGTLSYKPGSGTAGRRDRLGGCFPVDASQWSRDGDGEGQRNG